MRNLFSYLVVVLLVGCGKPQHNYVVRNADAYGYEHHVTDADKAKGVISHPIVMLEYAGKRGGVYQFVDALSEDKHLMVFDCSEPCEFFRYMEFTQNGVHEKTEFLRTTKGSIVARAFEDAKNGFLKPYLVTEAGNGGNRMWFTQKGVQLMTDTGEEGNP